MDVSISRKLQKTAVQMRMDLLEMFGCDGMRSGHWGGSSSLCEIMACLYFYKMNYKPEIPDWEGRDYLIMSKGHSVPAQYAALIEAGFINREEMQHFKCCGSCLSGHPEMDRTPGVEANTGSLGMGLSIGLGVAMGERLNGKDNHVYVILGDGELNEGQVWEAAMAAPAFGLNHLTAIVDCNGFQASGSLAEVMPSGDIRAKWEAFGWNVFEVNGHDVVEICDALDKASLVSGPAVILAHTVKGKGLSFAENSASFHNATFTPEQYEQAVNEIGNWLNRL